MRESGLGKLQKKMMGRWSDTVRSYLLPEYSACLVANRWVVDGQLHPDDAYLSYHDVRLMREDIQTLKNDWLTDNVISFWEEYLEHEYLSKLEHANIILLRPSMSFMLLQTSDPRTLRDALPDFTRATHVFLPINDCRNVTEAEGGTHWSLLVVSIVDRIAFHYDSLPPGNRMEAGTITMKLGVLLNCPIRFVHLEDAPEQENSSDCGDIEGEFASES
ncbi:hypothetical protein ZTR_05921 [Talaromyces verruculosus]|nr:hypothetical protein ZTR_05921 [Talaromyces verruculosus]